MTPSMLEAEARLRTSTLDRPTLMKLAVTEYERFPSMLRHLTPEDWERPTECPGWDVRAVGGHCLGMAEMAASMGETLRQQRLAAKRGGVPIDALTSLQVDEHADLTTSELIARFERIGPKAARARRRTPGFIRGRKFSQQQDVGEHREFWTIGYLLDTILTRDPWMHRIDISRAVGKSVDTTAEHDGVLVADVVDEWSARHGKPCRLSLTGPAGGRWTFGIGGPNVELDAIDFCRTLSGRGTGDGLLATRVPF